MPSMRLTAAAVALIGAIAVARPGSAAPIEGSIGFGGAWEPILTDGTSTTIGNAQAVDIVDNEASVVPNIRDGDFTQVASDAVVDYNDIDFTSAGGTPIDPLWGPLGTENFRFSLESVSVQTQNNNVLALSGGGTMTGDGFDPTDFVWDFSGQTTGGEFTFSTTSSQPIDTPPSLLLLGVALCGLGIALRLNASNA